MKQCWFHNFQWQIWLNIQNPYGKGGDPCGSSSGSAISVAANMAAVSLGTETDGSILCPADYNSVVGIKPTVGLTSRAGVIPISPRQDTIGYENLTKLNPSSSSVLFLSVFFLLIKDEVDLGYW